MGYLGIFQEACAEQTIERSRFIGYAARTAGEEEAKAFLSEVRLRHPTATHVCYGYIADELGNLQRFSDAGEPQGTAGLPILGVLKAQKLFASAVAVVRYFGGIKLGAGGLTRAYASTAADVLSQAEKRSYEDCTELALTVGYREVGALTRFLEEGGAEIVGREFGAGAAFTVCVKNTERERFLADLNEALLGRVKAEPKGSYLHPFPVIQK